ncbi:hypothetical protein V2O64_14685 [Verrucomicrobiaceae bacterium 227]
MSLKTLRNLIVVACGIAGTGYLRMPVEQNFTEDLRERKAIPPPISQEVWGQMGQNSFAGVLGGLRTVMASTRSLFAQKYFEEKEWYDLKREYEIITTLDPYNSFYWDHGGWHLAYNAAAWARFNEDLSPIRRQFLEREFLEAGDAFYHKGLALLPENAGLWSQVGRLWSNPHKRPDLNRAAEAYKMAAKYGNSIDQRTYLSTLARIPGREIEALDVAAQLLISNRHHLAIPTFRSILFCLSTNPDLPENALKAKLGEVFIDKEQAYKDLYNYRPRVEKDGYYGGELDKVLKSLIEELHVPDHLNPFKPGSKPRIYDNNWRREVDQPKILRPKTFPGFPGQE